MSDKFVPIHPRAHINYRPRLFLNPQDPNLQHQPIPPAIRNKKIAPPAQHEKRKLPPAREPHRLFHISDGFGLNKKPRAPSHPQGGQRSQRNILLNFHHVCGAAPSPALLLLLSIRSSSQSLYRKLERQHRLPLGLHYRVTETTQPFNELRKGKGFSVTLCLCGEWFSVR